MNKVIFFTLLFFISCKNDSYDYNIKIKNEQVVDSINKPDNIYTPPHISAQGIRLKNLELYKKNILNNGKDFAILDLTLINEGDYFTILPYAVVAAEKYKNRDAYESFYTSFIKIVNNGVYKDEFYFNFEPETQQFLKHYLVKGAKLGQTKCKEILLNLEKIANERNLSF